MTTIIEQAIKQPAFDEIKTEIFSNNFPWYFTESTAYKNAENSIEGYSFFHTAITNEGKKNSYMADILTFPIKETLETAIGKNIEIFRLRLCLSSPKSKVVIHGPHVDQHFDHMSAILYLNDNDGDTYFYNENYDPGSKMSFQKYYETILNSKVTVQKCVTPKENRLVYFNGFQYHSSSTPTNTARRVVVNINYMVK